MHESEQHRYISTGKREQLTHYSWVVRQSGTYLVLRIFEWVFLVRQRQEIAYANIKRVHNAMHNLYVIMK